MRRTVYLAFIALILAVGAGVGLKFGYFDKIDEDIAAAESGNATAQYELAMKYRFGLSGKDKSELQAEAWYLKAAKQGHADAQCDLAAMYSKSDLPELQQKALFWYNKAVEQGLARAQWNLGLAYGRGKFGLPVDEMKSLYLIRQAARQGHAPAQELLRAANTQW
ncbi:tetratricopeptide repeat protein [Aeromonas hydrophila]|uniref:tetratricopeptide repeat protein n=1 Tax=Aeromonas hydrophila TaxID=644 RepID=UPI003671BB4D